MRHRVFHDLASLNAAIAAAVEAFNDRPYSDGSGECRRTRFEAVDRPHLKPLPARRWQRTEWRQNKVHKDYHIAIDRHFYSVPYEYIDQQVDVRLRGDLVEVFHKGQQIASHARSRLKGRATTLREHEPLKHQRPGIEGTRVWIEREARERGAHVHGFVVAVMGRYPALFRQLCRPGLVFCLPSDQCEVIAGLAISLSMWQCAGHGDAAFPGFVH